MDYIRLAIIDEQPIVGKGIIAMLSDVPEIQVIHHSRGFDQAVHQLGHQQANVILMMLYRPDPDHVQQVKLLTERFLRSPLLVLSLFRVENFIFSLIRAGARGHLTGETTREEIIEAIFSLRHGYDFISKTISNMVLMNYLNEKGDEGPEQNLSSRELEVLKLFAQSMTNSEIAENLFISIRTVETHKNNIMRKLNLRTSVDMVKFALRNNLTNL
ncbi:MAG TPA: response regulator transcription factor [Bacteroidales bacterium]|nr:response regulator transcription factor [Bacteroidales bacterium]